MSAEVTLTGGEPVASADGQESEGRRVFKNAALLGAGHSLRFVMGFATTILITDQLGTDYGLLIGTALDANGNVNRVWDSNVRIPRSHSITLGFPRSSTYSSASSNSSIVALGPRLSRTGRPALPTASSKR